MLSRLGCLGWVLYAAVGLVSSGDHRAPSFACRRAVIIPCAPEETHAVRSQRFLETSSIHTVAPAELRTHACPVVGSTVIPPFVPPSMLLVVKRDASIMQSRCDGYFSSAAMCLSSRARYAVSLS